MRAKEIRRDLEAMDRNLENLIERLTLAPSHAHELQPKLAQLAVLMGEMREHRSSLTQNPQLFSLIRNIQARLARLQMLLDSAVTFYCGAISAAISQTGAYTPSGEVSHPGNSGYLHVQA
jgi:hypothetical protein